MAFLFGFSASFLRFLLIKFLYNRLNFHFYISNIILW